MVKHKMISGRNIAHATRNAVQCAFLGAVKKLRPAEKKSAVASEISKTEFVEMFGAVGKEVRGACIRAFADEALEVIDDATSPDIGRAVADDLFAHLH